MIYLRRKEISALINFREAAIVIEDAYKAASSGRVNLPPVGHIDFPKRNADCHIKYGHLLGDEQFTIKVATGFPENSNIGIPTGNGLVLILSAKTGEVEAVLHDEMLLTDLRTGIGGAIASRLLSRPDAKRLLVLGTGPQSRYQVEAHQTLLPHLQSTMIWGRNEDRLDKFIKTLPSPHLVEPVLDLKAAIVDADIIVTATGARNALFSADWVKPGTHITAVGADAPGKKELDQKLVAKADIVAVDSIEQCVDHGEVSHAIGSGHLDQSNLIELGVLLETPNRSRTNDQQITIADLTGIAAQDIAIASFVLKQWKQSNQTS